MNTSVILFWDFLLSGTIPGSTSGGALYIIYIALSWFRWLIQLISGSRNLKMYFNHGDGCSLAVVCGIEGGRQMAAKYWCWSGRSGRSGIEFNFCLQAF